MAKSDSVESKLDTLIDLTKHLIVIELARGGVPQNQIAKHVRLQAARVNKMLKGVKKQA
jgi:hypothetical protein